MNCPAGVMRPILSYTGSVNHRLSSGPLTIPPESPPCGTTNSVSAPDGVMRPMPFCLVYQTFPSGPGVMAMGPMRVDGVMKRPKLEPWIVRLPIAGGAVLWWVNQILPSGPAQMAPGELGVGTANSVKVMSGPLTGIAGAPLPPAPTMPPPVPVVVAVGIDAVPALPPTPPAPVVVLPDP